MASRLRTGPQCAWNDTQARPMTRGTPCIFGSGKRRISPTLVPTHRKPGIQSKAVTLIFSIEIYCTWLSTSTKTKVYKLLQDGKMFGIYLCTAFIDGTQHLGITNYENYAKIKTKKTRTFTNL